MQGPHFGRNSPGTTRITCITCRASGCSSMAWLQTLFFSQLFFKAPAVEPLALHHMHSLLVQHAIVRACSALRELAGTHRPLPFSLPPRWPHLLRRMTSAAASCLLATGSLRTVAMLSASVTATMRSRWMPRESRREAMGEGSDRPDVWREGGGGGGEGVRKGVCEGAWQ